MIASRRRKVEREPTIALINIVFLILIFFMVAGTLSEMPREAFEFVSSGEMDSSAPGDILVIARDGCVSFGGRSYAGIEDAIAAHPELRGEARILPARDLPGAELLAAMRDLREAGVARILLVAERE
ncbi:biopolymer transporter ExbD [Erythrobacter sp. HL-111]|uniref:ExbD/TolR family protein n=1 Tax=Erythrobacter sp. HL-111 TaxID=1798193 RepID=UPI0006D9A051|nr:biopolymer transporter ExbD [Erythrobacter sp. HL-111]KPP92929.1 MAG: biopolymer transport protein ExbD [Erythrobacteraceae bacterium HL-111]SDT02224.1 Biopolymer transport protein ExbD [Erythrobacter sp. HL-111]